MISVLLTILKILGMILLVLLGICILLMLLVLFVPVRYRITARRKPDEGIPITAAVKFTWLLHIVNILFDYPEAAYVRARIFCFTIFRSDRRKEEKSKEEAKSAADKPEETAKSAADKPEEAAKASLQDHDTSGEKAWEEIRFDEKEPTAAGFLKRLWRFIKNIGYTIRRIYDKIKHIVKNIRYYIRILQSETFRRALDHCTLEAGRLLKSLRPRKIQGKLLVGTDDPAVTGQILAVWGMLYPLIGEHISITPDFEQQVLEGDLLIIGRITAFQLLRAAWAVYFNRDLRHLIHLLKREDLNNGRQ